MKRVWILTRTTGSYEDQRTENVFVFISSQSAERARKHCVDWFEQHPRPEFDEVWSEALVAFDPKKVARLTCPYDPGHVDDHVLEVPSYGIAVVDIGMLREFTNPEHLAIARADREMFNNWRKKP